MKGKKVKQIIALALTSAMIFTGNVNTFAQTIIGEEAEEVTVSENSTSDTYKTDIWDFGAYVAAGESDTEKYNNYITPTTFAEKITVDSKKRINSTTPATFGDLDWGYVAGDRYYSNKEALEDLKYGTWTTNYQKEYADGYLAEAGWYSNGTRTESTGYLTVKNCKAGDKLVFYAGSNNKTNIEYGVKQLTGTNKDKVTSLGESAGFEKYEFICTEAADYKIYQMGGGGKPFHHRVKRVPATRVSGTLDFGEITPAENMQIRFTNTTTEDVILADVVKEESVYKYSVALPSGYSYLSSITGISGCGFSSDTKMLTVTDANSYAGISNRTFNVIEQTTYKLTGSISGYTEDTNNVFENLTIKFVPNQLAGLDTVKATITKTADAVAYEAEGLVPDNDYELVLSGANDYMISSPEKVNKSENATVNIALSKAATYDVTGAFTGAENIEVTALSFKNVDDNYTYTATVNDNGYSVKLRDGAYEAAATVKDNKYKTTSHVVVEGKNVGKDLFFVETTKTVTPATANDIYVGYEQKANNYDTVKEAVAAAKAKGTSADSRITIHIAPGTYREQIKVDTPYISFVNDEYANGKEVLLTWYYGIDYKYYSIGADGFYNEERAVDKYEKTTVQQKWGTCVYVTKNATEFRAEGITFENSFNKYITDEELEDGVKLDGAQGNAKVERTYATDVRSKTATERAAAICTEAAHSEYRNCKFIGSQDTLYTAADTYFKNCFIEGQTDYIFGSGNVVFDACELRFAGYTTGSVGGYITAGRPADAEAGYLFRNCTVTGNSDEGITVTAGYFGRPWGANAAVVFNNTKLENSGLIAAEGWKDMSGNLPANANFYENNTKLISGAAVKKAEVSKSITDAKVDTSTYFGTWTPVFFTAEATSVSFESDPQITSNADLNVPHPGNTLTVKYEINDKTSDASTIIWYADDEIVKCSTAVAGPSYKLRTQDTGKTIKVVVRPELISGITGTEKSYTLVEKVKEGYEDPSNAGAAELGEGINVFLAGDSTVKDYSAKGIYQGGKISAEGSWGEYLQSFFDEKLVKVQDYANGGRSSRTFLNDHVTSSDKSSQTIFNRMVSEMKTGDYLFIQFGHNDCGGAQYADRYVKIGTPDANGIYPLTPGNTDENGDYPQDNEGTYKWFLKQYIDAAKSKGAIPVLVTPVSRMYYNSDGTIKPHHMVSGEENDCYVKAVKQLGEEESVLVIDAYQATKNMFEAAWKECGNDKYGYQLMASTSEKTHNNKLGGMIEAVIMATEIQNSSCGLRKYVNMPTGVAGVDNNGNTQFAINRSGNLSAFDSFTTYADPAEFWTSYGQTAIDAIKTKHDEIIQNGEGESGESGESGKNDGSGDNESGKNDGSGDSNENQKENAGSSDKEIIPAAEKAAVAKQINDIVANGLLTDKNATGTVRSALAVDASGKTVDTVALDVTYAKRKVSAITPAGVKGIFTINAGSKVVLPGVNPKDKSQAYIVTATDGTKVDTASEKLKDKNFKIKNGVITTKVNKKLPKYSFEVAYKVENVQYEYTINVINIGFKKEYKKKTLKAVASEGAQLDSAVVNLDGDYLGAGENTITGAVWMIGKDTVLVPGVVTEVKNKKGETYAKVTLSVDSKSVKVESVGTLAANGKPVTGAVAITASVFNGKKLKTTIKIVK